MADEKKATGHEEQAPPAVPNGSKAPPVPQAEQQPVQLGIEKPDAPASDKKAEKSGPDHAVPVAEPKDGPKIPDGKVIDITGKVAPGAEVPAPGEDKKTAKTAPEKKGQDAPAKKGKAQAGPEKADKAPTPRKATKDKAAGKTPKEQRDKVSQGKVVPEQPVAGGGSGPGSAPAVKAPAEPTPPPRPVEEGKLVYLKLSELHPFHTFRAHPFKVRDDAKMQETVASIKENGVTPTPDVEPEPEPVPEQKGGGNMGTLLLALAVVVIGGGAGWYFKIYRPKQQRAADLEEDDYPDGPEPAFEDGYDDNPPWDEDDPEDAE